MSSRAPVVLVVEDNPANLALVRAILELDAMTVITATTLAEARRLAPERLPDVILLDIRMPDGDGLELAREWKASEAIASTPVIALTAHAMQTDAESAALAGCDGFITKPLNARTFALQVRAHLEGNQH